MLKGYKTYTGIGIAALVALAPVIGVDVPAGDELPAWLDNVVSMAALVFAWYGRAAKERRAPE